MMFEPLSPVDHSHSPIYMQVANNLRRQIMSGETEHGEALPSERDLCDIMGTSRVTVRKAIEMLIDEGLLSRRQGSGTFVASRIQLPGSYLSSFSEDAQARGLAPETVWIQKLAGIASEEEAQLLGLDPRACVARLNRVRKAGGEPLAIENAVVPLAMIVDINSIGQSLYAALADCGNRPLSGEQKIRAARANAEEAALLSIAEKSEILRIERLTRRSDGRAVELTRSVYRGDRYEFVSALRGELIVI